ncbi:MAG: DNA translocase FtsK 4TM domain-containing protein [Defluviicoccus sp.]|nr:MAG: DNA translocase FtsK 4TM domain-containing protein [Defluviicoccus sp.]
MIRTGTLAILPAGVAEFLKRRCTEFGGFVLLAAGTGSLLALASYSPGDPSLNHATLNPPVNVLGTPGAYLADALLLGFGGGAVVPVLGLLAWGWRVIARRPMRYAALQVVSLVAALFLLAMALAGLPPVPGWSLAAGPGGAIGLLLLERLAAETTALPLLSRAGIALLAFALGVAALIYGMGVSLADWRQLLRIVINGVTRVRAGMHQLCARITALRLPAFRLRLPVFGSRRRVVDPFDTEPVLRTPRASRTRSVEELSEVDTARSDPHADGRPGAPATGVVEAKVTRIKPGRKAEEAAQHNLDFDMPSSYRLPSLDLLQPPRPSVMGDGMTKAALEQNARMLKTVLDDFGVRGEIVKVRPGPVITLYELEPAPGTKSARVIALADDIARSMSAVSARVAVVTGRNAIGIELPNQRRETVGLRELLASEAMERHSGSLLLALGKDIGGAPVIADLAKMPHLLIAGTTGSGKSVGINAMILSLLYRLSPDTCKFILIDPKMLELSVYDGIPHLLSPVVIEPAKAVVALKWTVREMEERYRSMSQLGVRNITGFNERVRDALRRGEPIKRRVQTGYDDDGKPRFEEQELDVSPLPLIVVVVDEMADLMLVAGKDIEAAVQRLSQMARAAGIHLIMATQRPSVDVITGTIKANFPTRISFQVTSKIDSRTILGEQGAEQLLGQGDMLYMASGGRVTRVHGPFVSDCEVEHVVKALKAQGEPQYIEAVTEAEEEDASMSGSREDNGAADQLYDEAVAAVLREGKASTSFVQRRLQIGYNRAARLVERMEDEGLVSKADRVGRREVLVGERAS